MQKRKIAALGPAGTNGHQAAVLAQALLKERGIEVPEVWFQSRNEEILAVTAVMGSKGCFGVVPIENASAGLIREIVDHWLFEAELKYRAELFVIGEIHLPIHHNLLVHPSIRNVHEIRSVMSHPQALAQCAGRLNGMGLSSTIPSASTAGAAKQVASDPGMKNTAAVASAFAGEYYELKVMEVNLEDYPGNATRFHVLGPEPMGPTGSDRTAVIFRLPNKPGVLSAVFQAVASEMINMSSVHSIPLGFMNGFAFYIELDCHMDTKEGRAIQNKLKLHTVDPIILGSYPRSIHIV